MSLTEIVYSTVAKLATTGITRWIVNYWQRLWKQDARVEPEAAFRALLSRVKGLLRQIEADGGQQGPALESLAEELEKLDIWPRGIRRECESARIRPELIYLRRAMSEPGQLSRVRERFSNTSMQENEPDFTDDLLGEHFERLLKKTQN